MRTPPRAARPHGDYNIYYKVPVNG